MTLDPQASILYALRDVGMISPAQYRRALAHPQYSELAAFSDPADYLVWLVCRDIISEQQVKEKGLQVADTLAGDELEQHKATVVNALLMLEESRKSFNRKWFDTLVAEKLITLSERNLALEQASSEHLLASPAAALAWMALSGVISGARLSPAAVRAATGGAKQAEILAEARDIHNKTKSSVRSAVLSAIFPGPGWLWIAAPVLGVAFLIWTVLKPASVPSCTDSDVTRTLRSMLFMAKIDARVANVLGGHDQTLPTPNVHDVKDVGLATETGVRGCLATLKFDADEIPYAFTISPVKDDKDGESGYRVTGAEPAIVQARYGHLDANGAFLNKAEPIGREEVERAFRSGAERLSTGRASFGREPHFGSALSTTAPERKREIAEVEPMGPCREVKPGTMVSCRLLVERNDPFLAALGTGSSTLLDSAFTFERDSATGPWRVSDAFTEEYLRAIAAARLKAVGLK